MEKEFKGTSGLWHYRQDPTKTGFYIETVDKSHDKTFIAEVGGGLQSMREVEQNAALIAAAPELLEALREAKETIKNWYEIGGSKDWDFYDTKSPEMKRINSAINKALNF